MKHRLISELKKLFLFLGIGFLYYIWILHTNIYIPCIFKAITGLRCPGCGISHMFMAICRFDFYGAFQENPFLFVTLPFILIIYITKRIYYIRNNKKMPENKLTKLLKYLFLVALIFFGIIRNLPL